MVASFIQPGRSSLSPYFDSVLLFPCTRALSWFRHVIVYDTRGLQYHRMRRFLLAPHRHQITHTLLPRLAFALPSLPVYAVRGACCVRHTEAGGGQA